MIVENIDEAKKVSIGNLEEEFPGGSMMGTLAAVLLFVSIAGVLSWLVCDMIWRNS